MNHNLPPQRTTTQELVDLLNEGDSTTEQNAYSDLDAELETAFESLHADGRVEIDPGTEMPSVIIPGHILGNSLLVVLGETGYIGYTARTPEMPATAMFQFIHKITTQDGKKFNQRMHITLPFGEYQTTPIIEETLTAEEFDQSTHRLGEMDSGEHSAFVLVESAADSKAAVEEARRALLNHPDRLEVYEINALSELVRQIAAAA